MPIGSLPYQLNKMKIYIELRNGAETTLQGVSSIQKAIEWISHVVFDKNMSVCVTISYKDEWHELDFTSQKDALDFLSLFQEQELKISIAKNEINEIENNIENMIKEEKLKQEKDDDVYKGRELEADGFVKIEE